MKAKNTLLMTIFCIIVVSMTSCSQSNNVAVRGVVLLDGEPVNDASISFIPTGSDGQIASGFTDESGRFDMYTSEEGDGVKPGRYKVTVIAMEPLPEGTKTISSIMAEKYTKKSTNMTSAEAQKLVIKQAAAQARKPKVTPPIYGDPMKTPLTADVPAQTEYKFELTKNPASAKTDDNAKDKP